MQPNSVDLMLSSDLWSLIYAYTHGILDVNIEYHRIFIWVDRWPEQPGNGTLEFTHEYRWKNRNLTNGCLYAAQWRGLPGMWPDSQKIYMEHVFIQ